MPETQVAVRVVAVLAARNEQRFVGGCIENLIRQGIEVYLCDDASTDATISIAERYLGRGLIGIESLPNDGVYRWRRILERKEELFAALDADWMIHVDADEILLPPPSHATLVDAFAEAEQRGYDAAHFFEFTFIPTRESPDHDHPRFRSTLRSYYPFCPTFPHCVRAWKKRAEGVEIAWSGGHHVRWPSGQPRLWPESCRMRHYLFLSAEHAIEKYRRRYDAEELNLTWHGWRAELRAEHVVLPGTAELRTAASDAELDPSAPRTAHWLGEQVERASRSVRTPAS